MMILMLLVGMATGVGMWGLCEASVALLATLEPMLRTPEFRERMGEKTHE